LAISIWHKLISWIAQGKQFCPFVVAKNLIYVANSNKLTVYFKVPLTWSQQRLTMITFVYYKENNG
jgi:hypothetical protein